MSDFWRSNTVRMMMMSNSHQNSSSNTMDDCFWNTVVEILVTISSLYGVQILLCVTLGAITIYRREMSCNHCYHPAVVTADAVGASVSTNSAAASVNAASPADASADRLKNLPKGPGEHHQQGDSSLKSSYKTTATCPLRVPPATTTRAASPLLLPTLFSTTGSDTTTTTTNTASSCQDDNDADTNGRGEGSSCDGHVENMNSISSSAHDALLVSGCLAPDVLVHILSHLSPRDVISFGGTCQAARIVVHGEKKEKKKNSLDDAAAATATKMTTSAMLWKTLWRRDYAWVVESWMIGRQAMQRSSSSSNSNPATTTFNTNIGMATKQQPEAPPLNEEGEEYTLYSPHLAESHPGVTFDANFYFRFATSWLNFVLAGRNCVQNGCYVGIGGHVYDMTSFVVVHPGSPETVLVQAGRDATAFFTNVRHSAGAMRLAQSMCVVVDQSRLPPPSKQVAASPQQPVSSSSSSTEKEPSNNATAPSLSSSSLTTSASCGLRPTMHLLRLESTLLRKQPQHMLPQQQLPNEQCVIPELSLSDMSGNLSSSSSRHGGGANVLQRIQTQHAREEALALQRAQQTHAKTRRLTDVNVYYHPFLQTWLAWYTNPNMETVFCNVE